MGLKALSGSQATRSTANKRSKMTWPRQISSSAIGRCLPELPMLALYQAIEYAHCRHRPMGFGFEGILMVKWNLNHRIGESFQGEIYLECLTTRTRRDRAS